MLIVFQNDVIMPRKYKLAKIKFYEKDKVFDVLEIHRQTFDELLKEYMGFVGMLSEGKFSFVTRLDFISSGRVLYSFQSYKYIDRQIDYCVNLKLL